MWLRSTFVALGFALTNDGDLTQISSGTRLNLEFKKIIITFLGNLILNISNI